MVAPGVPDVDSIGADGVTSQPPDVTRPPPRPSGPAGGSARRRPGSLPAVEELDRWARVSVRDAATDAFFDHATVIALRCPRTLRRLLILDYDHGGVGQVEQVAGRDPWVWRTSDGVVVRLRELVALRRWRAAATAHLLSLRQIRVAS